MFQETELGFELRVENTLMFFGKKGCTLTDLKQHYADIEFRTVHQTHSDLTVVSSVQSETVQADGHYTQEMNVGLIIKTADCIPVLVHVPTQHLILAIHAGWRGVENQITLKAFKQLNFGAADSVSVYMGPHILQPSFEVQEDVKDLLLRSACVQNVDLFYTRGEKYYVDLQTIVKSQIQALVPQAQIHFTDMNTYKNEQFNSYRTDQTKLRNLSFIVQKSAPV